MNRQLCPGPPSGMAGKAWRRDKTDAKRDKVWRHIDIRYGKA